MQSSIQYLTSCGRTNRYARCVQITHVWLTMRLSYRCSHPAGSSMGGPGQDVQYFGGTREDAAHMGGVSPMNSRSASRFAFVSPVTGRLYPFSSAS